MKLYVKKPHSSKVVDTFFPLSYVCPFLKIFLNIQIYIIIDKILIHSECRFCLFVFADNASGYTCSGGIFRHRLKYNRVGPNFGIFAHFDIAENFLRLPQSLRLLVLWDGDRPILYLGTAEGNTLQDRHHFQSQRFRRRQYR